MVADPRYFDRLGPLTLSRIAALSGAAISVSGDGEEMIGEVAPLEALVAGSLGYAESVDRILSGEISLPAGAALIVRPDQAGELTGRGVRLLEHRQPRGAFALAAAALFAPRGYGDGDPVASDADIAASAVIGPQAVIGPGARIGERVTIGAGAVIAKASGSLRSIGAPA